MKPDDIISYSELVAEEKANLQGDVMRGSSFPQSEPNPQAPSSAKNKMFALLSQLFCGTQMPLCPWFLAKNKSADAKRGETAYVDNDLALAA